jgi:hypothetical protein
MIGFAKLISGEYVIGELCQDGISKIIKVDLIPDSSSGKHNINISPYMPFEQRFLPDIEESKIMCKIPADEEEYADLLTYYKTIKNQLYPISIH